MQKDVVSRPGQNDILLYWDRIQNTFFVSCSAFSSSTASRNRSE